MVPGSIRHDLNGFLLSPNPSSRTMALGVWSASYRSEYQKVSWGKVRPAREAQNLTAIWELFLHTSGLELGLRKKA
jgi:hypothetical protein